MVKITLGSCAARTILLMILLVGTGCDETLSSRDGTGGTTGTGATAGMGGSAGTGGTGGTDDSYPSAVTDVLDLPWPPNDYQDTLPAHFTSADVLALDNTPIDNPLTDAGATLGRVLFYDTLLSANQTVACASCHQAAEGFSDPDTLSTGFDGGLTGRHSMSLANLAYYENGRAFWDERSDSLEAQALLPIQDEVEMGLTLAELVTRVSSAAYYSRLFEDAFGDDTVTSERIGMAIAQFVRSMVSYRSPFDEGMAGTGDIRADFDNFTAQENQGKTLFLGAARCSVCHLQQDGPPGGPMAALGNQAIFLINNARNNGLDADTGPTGTNDGGVGDVTGNANDEGRFKSSSMRNIGVSAPYMHDGRFETLAEVIEHYDTGVQDHPNLDMALREPGPEGAVRRLNLTANERAALEAFLHTLTDTKMMSDERYQDPFR